MKIDRIQTFAVKIPYHDRFGGQPKAPITFPASDYYFEDEWREVYATKTQTLLIRIDTDEGVHGWGESQAPIVPEAAQVLIDEVLGPMLIGSDPRQVEVLWDRLYRSMNVRGHFTGVMLDAISGLDTALWDIKAKAAGEPLFRLLGGPFRTRLPAYVSGLRAPSPQGRVELAAALFAEGYAGVKLYLGRGVEADIEQAEAVRGRVGSKGSLFADLFWIYSLEEATRLGRALQALGVEWIESPLHPEDIRGHAALARTLDIAVAVGEPLRTRYQFFEWLARGAVDVAQPDIARCGITEGTRICNVVSAFHRPVAFHLGVSLAVSMAATWHMAASTPDCLIQEHEPPMLELSNELLTQPLCVDRGALLVPEGPGLGIDIDMKALAAYASPHETPRSRR
jgi:L-alanine-DL-glutamate epimerase-like enolase superfamily enzyme